MSTARATSTAASTPRAASLPRRPGVLALVVVAIAVALIPLNASPFINLQFTLVLVYAVAILGLDVLIGSAGQVSLGQSFFFGLGAYATAIAVTRGLPLPLAGILGAVLGGVVGALVAIPAVRLRGYALAMVTLALPVVGVPLATRLTSLTGGSQGLVVRTADAPAWTGLANDQWHFYIVAVVVAIVFLLIANLLRGRFGRAFASIRANEVLATAMGIPVQRYKILAFTISAACGGIAGALYVVAAQYISPETLVLTLSISLLASLVVGGLRSPLGAVLGAGFYVLVPNVAGSVSAGQSFLIYGLFLLVAMIVLPGGIASLARRARSLLRNRLRRHPPSTDINASAVPAAPTEGHAP